MVRRKNKRPDATGVMYVEAPEPPEDLTGEARAEWERIVPEIEAAGYLTTLDRGALTRYCKAWGEYCELTQNLAATGKLVRNRNGDLVRNPLWLMRNTVEQTMYTLGRELGLSPSSRRRMDVKHQRYEEEETAKPSNVVDWKERLAQ